MGQRFLKALFVRKCWFDKLKSCEGMWLLQWKCPQERIAMVEDNISSKKSKSERRVWDLRYICHVYYLDSSWVLMIHFQNLQFSHLQETDKNTRLQSAPFSLLCWSTYILINDLTIIGLETDFISEWVGHLAGLLGTWFPEPGLSDSQQWTENFLFICSKFAQHRKKKIFFLLP